jgi:bifunctional DNA-binding transcriptional regulator/antitoxin component of YhaV-PrlF toxin-antitoxin module
MSELVKLTAAGDLPLPLDVREALGVSPGGTVEIDISANGDVRLRRPEQVRLKANVGRFDLRGALAKLSHLRTYRDPEEIMREIRGGDPFPP